MLLIMPSDHHIDNPRAFLDAVEAGYEAAKKGMFVTFGVKPSKPETGFGYVKTGAGAGFDHVLKVDRFVEKPDTETAKRFCAEPGYFWNAGIFLFGARAYLDELSKFEPSMVQSCLDAVKNATIDYDFIRLADSFRYGPADFIDYAVMEKTDRAALVVLDAGWSDVGTWDALFDAAAKDGEDNAVRGDVPLRNASRCYVRAESGMVAIAGVDDIIVVSTKTQRLSPNAGKAVPSKRSCSSLPPRAETRSIIT